MATNARFSGVRTNPNAPTTAAGFRSVRAGNRPSQVSVKPGQKVGPVAAPDPEKTITDLRVENQGLRDQLRAQAEKLKAAEGKLAALASDLAPAPS